MSVSFIEPFASLHELLFDLTKLRLKERLCESWRRHRIGWRLFFNFCCNRWSKLLHHIHSFLLGTKWLRFIMLPLNQILAKRYSWGSTKGFWLLRSPKMSEENGSFWNYFLALLNSMIVVKMRLLKLTFSSRPIQKSSKPYP